MDAETKKRLLTMNDDLMTTVELKQAAITHQGPDLHLLSNPASTMGSPLHTTRGGGGGGGGPAIPPGSANPNAKLSKGGKKAPVITPMSQQEIDSLTKNIVGPYSAYQIERIIQLQRYYDSYTYEPKVSDGGRIPDDGSDPLYQVQSNLTTIARILSSQLEDEKYWEELKRENKEEEEFERQLREEKLAAQNSVGNKSPAKGYLYPADDDDAEEYIDDDALFSDCIAGGSRFRARVAKLRDQLYNSSLLSGEKDIMFNIFRFAKVFQTPDILKTPLTGFLTLLEPHTKAYQKEDPNPYIEAYGRPNLQIRLLTALLRFRRDETNALKRIVKNLVEKLTSTEKELKVIAEEAAREGANEIVRLKARLELAEREKRFLYYRVYGADSVEYFAQQLADGTFSQTATATASAALNAAQTALDAANSASAANAPPSATPDTSALTNPLLAAVAALTAQNAPPASPTGALSALGALSAPTVTSPSALSIAAAANASGSTSSPAPTTPAVGLTGAMLKAGGLKALAADTTTTKAMTKEQAAIHRQNRYRKEVDECYLAMRDAEVSKAVAKVKGAKGQSEFYIKKLEAHLDQQREMTTEATVFALKAADSRARAVEKLRVMEQRMMELHDVMPLGRVVPIKQSLRRAERDAQKIFGEIKPGKFEAHNTMRELPGFTTGLMAGNAALKIGVSPKTNRYTAANQRAAAAQHSTMLTEIPTIPILNHIGKNNIRIVDVSEAIVKEAVPYLESRVQSIISKIEQASRGQSTTGASADDSKANAAKRIADSSSSSKRKSTFAAAEEEPAVSATEYSPSPLYKHDKTVSLLRHLTGAAEMIRQSLCTMTTMILTTASGNGAFGGRKIPATGFYSQEGGAPTPHPPPATLRLMAEIEAEERALQGLLDGPEALLEGAASGGLGESAALDGSVSIGLNGGESPLLDAPLDPERQRHVNTINIITNRRALVDAVHRNSNFAGSALAMKTLKANKRKHELSERARALKELTKYDPNDPESLPPKNPSLGPMDYIGDNVYFVGAAAQLLHHEGFLQEVIDKMLVSYMRATEMAQFVDPYKLLTTGYRLDSESSSKKGRGKSIQHEGSGDLAAAGPSVGGNFRPSSSVNPSGNKRLSMSQKSNSPTNRGARGKRGGGRRGSTRSDNNDSSFRDTDAEDDPLGQSTRPSVQMCDQGVQAVLVTTEELNAELNQAIAFNRGNGNDGHRGSRSSGSGSIFAGPEHGGDEDEGAGVVSLMGASAAGGRSHRQVSIISPRDDSNSTKKASSADPEFVIGGEDGDDAQPLDDNAFGDSINDGLNDDEVPPTEEEGIESPTPQNQRLSTISSGTNRTVVSHAIEAAHSSADEDDDDDVSSTSTRRPGTGDTDYDDVYHDGHLEKYGGSNRRSPSSSPLTSPKGSGRPPKPSSAGSDKKASSSSGVGPAKKKAVTSSGYGATSSSTKKGPTAGRPRDPVSGAIITPQVRSSSAPVATIGTNTRAIRTRNAYCQVAMVPCGALASDGASMGVVVANGGGKAAGSSSQQQAEATAAAAKRLAALPSDIDSALIALSKYHQRQEENQQQQGNHQPTNGSFSNSSLQGIAMDGSISNGSFRKPRTSSLGPSVPSLALGGGAAANGEDGLVKSPRLCPVAIPTNPYANTLSSSSAKSSSSSSAELTMVVKVHGYGPLLASLPSETVEAMEMLRHLINDEVRRMNDEIAAMATMGAASTPSSSLTSSGSRVASPMAISVVRCEADCFTLRLGSLLASSSSSSSSANKNSCNASLLVALAMRLERKATQLPYADRLLVHPSGAAVSAAEATPTDKQTLKMLITRRIAAEDARLGLVEIVEAEYDDDEDDQHQQDDGGKDGAAADGDGEETLPNSRRASSTAASSVRQKKKLGKLAPLRATVPFPSASYYACRGPRLGFSIASGGSSAELQAVEVMESALRDPMLSSYRGDESAVPSSSAPPATGGDAGKKSPPPASAIATPTQVNASIVCDLLSVKKLLEDARAAARIKNTLMGNNSTNGRSVNSASASVSAADLQTLSAHQLLLNEFGDAAVSSTGVCAYAAATVGATMVSSNTPTHYFIDTPAAALRDRYFGVLKLKQEGYTFATVADATDEAKATNTHTRHLTRHHRNANGGANSNNGGADAAAALPTQQHSIGVGTASSNSNGNSRSNSPAQQQQNGGDVFSSSYDVDLSGGDITTNGSSGGGPSVETLPSPFADSAFKDMLLSSGPAASLATAGGGGGGGPFAAFASSFANLHHQQDVIKHPTKVLCSKPMAFVAIEVRSLRHYINFNQFVDARRALQTSKDNASAAAADKASMMKRLSTTTSGSGAGNATPASAANALLLAGGATDEDGNPIVPAAPLTDEEAYEELLVEASTARAKLIALIDQTAAAMASSAENGCFRCVNWSATHRRVATYLRHNKGPNTAMGTALKRYMQGKPVADPFSSSSVVVDAANGRVGSGKVPPANGSRPATGAKGPASSGLGRPPSSASSVAAHQQMQHQRHAAAAGITKINGKLFRRHRTFQHCPPTVLVYACPDADSAVAFAAAAHLNALHMDISANLTNHFPSLGPQFDKSANGAGTAMMRGGDDAEGGASAGNTNRGPLLWKGVPLRAVIGMATPTFAVVSNDEAGDGLIHAHDLGLFGDLAGSDSESSSSEDEDDAHNDDEDDQKEAAKESAAGDAAHQKKTAPTRPRKKRAFNPHVYAAPMPTVEVFGEEVAIALSGLATARFGETLITQSAKANASGMRRRKSSTIVAAAEVQRPTAQAMATYMATTTADGEDVFGNGLSGATSSLRLNSPMANTTTSPPFIDSCMLIPVPTVASPSLGKSGTTTNGKGKGSHHNHNASSAAVFDFREDPANALYICHPKAIQGRYNFLSKMASSQVSSKRSLAAAKPIPIMGLPLLIRSWDRSVPMRQHEGELAMAEEEDNPKQHYYEELARNDATNVLLNTGIAVSANDLSLAAAFRNPLSVAEAIARSEVAAAVLLHKDYQQLLGVTEVPIDVGTIELIASHDDEHAVAAAAKARQQRREERRALRAEARRSRIRDEWDDEEEEDSEEYSSDDGDDRSSNASSGDDDDHAVMGDGLFAPLPQVSTMTGRPNTRGLMESLQYDARHCLQSQQQVGLSASLNAGTMPTARPSVTTLSTMSSSTNAVEGTDANGTAASSSSLLSPWSPMVSIGAKTVAYARRYHPSLVPSLKVLASYNTTANFVHRQSVLSPAIAKNVKDTLRQQQQQQNNVGGGSQQRRGNISKGLVGNIKAAEKFALSLKGPTENNAAVVVIELFQWTRIVCSLLEPLLPTSLTHAVDVLQRPGSGATSAAASPSAASPSTAATLTKFQQRQNEERANCLIAAASAITTAVRSLIQRHLDSFDGVEVSASRHFAPTASLQPFNVSGGFESAASRGIALFPYWSPAHCGGAMNGSGGGASGGGGSSMNDGGFSALEHATAHVTVAFADPIKAALCVSHLQLALESFAPTTSSTAARDILNASARNATSTTTSGGAGAAAAADGSLAAALSSSSTGASPLNATQRSGGGAQQRGSALGHHRGNITSSSQIVLSDGVTEEEHVLRAVNAIMAAYNGTGATTTTSGGGNNNSNKGLRVRCAMHYGPLRCRDAFAVSVRASMSAQNAAVAAKKAAAAAATASNASQQQQQQQKFTQVQQQAAAEAAINSASKAVFGHCYKHAFIGSEVSGQQEAMRYYGDGLNEAFELLLLGPRRLSGPAASASSLPPSIADDVAFLGGETITSPAFMQAIAAHPAVYVPNSSGPTSSSSGVGGSPSEDNAPSTTADTSKSLVPNTYNVAVANDLRQRLSRIITAYTSTVDVKAAKRGFAKVPFLSTIVTTDTIGALSSATENNAAADPSSSPSAAATAAAPITSDPFISPTTTNIVYLLPAVLNTRVKALGSLAKELFKAEAEVTKALVTLVNGGEGAAVPPPPPAVGTAMPPPPAAPAQSLPLTIQVKPALLRATMAAVASPSPLWGAYERLLFEAMVKAKNSMMPVSTPTAMTPSAHGGGGAGGSVNAATINCGIASSGGSGGGTFAYGVLLSRSEDDPACGAVSRKAQYGLLRHHIAIVAAALATPPLSYHAMAALYEQWLSTLGADLEYAVAAQLEAQYQREVVLDAQGEAVAVNGGSGFGDFANPKNGAASSPHPILVPSGTAGLGSNYLHVGGAGASSLLRRAQQVYGGGGGQHRSLLKSENAQLVLQQQQSNSNGGGFAEGLGVGVGPRASMQASSTTNKFLQQMMMQRHSVASVGSNMSGMSQRLGGAGRSPQMNNPLTPQTGGGLSASGVGGGMMMMGNSNRAIGASDLMLAASLQQLFRQTCAVSVKAAKVMGYPMLSLAGNPNQYDSRLRDAIGVVKMGGAAVGAGKDGKSQQQQQAAASVDLNTFHASSIDVVEHAKTVVQATMIALQCRTDKQSCFHRNTQTIIAIPPLDNSVDADAAVYRRVKDTAADGGEIFAPARSASRGADGGLLPPAGADLSLADGQRGSAAALGAGGQMMGGGGGGLFQLGGGANRNLTGAESMAMAMQRGFRPGGDQDITALRLRERRVMELESELERAAQQQNGAMVNSTVLTPHNTSTASANLAPISLAQEHAAAALAKSYFGALTAFNRPPTNSLLPPIPRGGGAVGDRKQSPPPTALTLQQQQHLNFSGHPTPSRQSPTNLPPIQQQQQQQMVPYGSGSPVAVGGAVNVGRSRGGPTGGHLLAPAHLVGGVMGNMNDPTVKDFTADAGFVTISRLDQSRDLRGDLAAPFQRSLHTSSSSPIPQHGLSPSSAMNNTYSGGGLGALRRGQHQLNANSSAIHHSSTSSAPTMPGNYSSSSVMSPLSPIANRGGYETVPPGTAGGDSVFGADPASSSKARPMGHQQQMPMGGNGGSLSVLGAASGMGKQQRGPSKAKPRANMSAEDPSIE